MKPKLHLHMDSSLDTRIQKQSTVWKGNGGPTPKKVESCRIHWQDHNNGFFWIPRKCCWSITCPVGSQLHLLAIVEKLQNCNSKQKEKVEQNSCCSAIMLAHTLLVRLKPCLSSFDRILLSVIHLSLLTFYQLFLQMKQHLRRRRFAIENELKQEVDRWLPSMVG